MDPSGQSIGKLPVANQYLSILRIRHVDPLCTAFLGKTNKNNADCKIDCELRTNQLTDGLFVLNHFYVMCTESHVFST